MWFDSESPEFVYLACHLKFFAHRKIQAHYSNGSLVFLVVLVLFVGFCGEISMGLLFIHVDVILLKILIQKILTWNLSRFGRTPSVHIKAFITVFFSHKPKIAFVSNTGITYA